jgi:protein-S-isoprenylcysteine O-methyltransferase Ste14
MLFAAGEVYRPVAVTPPPTRMGRAPQPLYDPLAPGSWWGWFTIIPITLVIVCRLPDEKTFPAGNLPGYSEYQNRVRYHLVPFIW